MTGKLRIKKTGESKFSAPIKQQIQSEDVLNPLLCMKYITEYLLRVAFPLLVQRLEVFVTCWLAFGSTIAL